MPVSAGFRNHPPRRLFLERERAEFEAALAAVRQDFGREHPLRLRDQELKTDDVVASVDPSHPNAGPLGFIHNAGTAEVGQALALVSEAAGRWAARPVSDRAGVLRRAAELLAERQDNVAAWEVYEAAKSWTEALADVAEAIDYLHFYAQEAERLEDLWSEYRPRGVVAVIPPWNFPAAIPCGMTAAALVTGNAVILKPAEQTPLVAWQLVQVLHEAGVPKDALVWLPGRGEVAGAALVAHPLVDMVAFTGSATVGTAIYRLGTEVILRRGGLRATIAEMGSKNAILVFPDADLDEAVVGVLASAFGHSNQKCSAASRVLVHRSILDRFSRRLVDGAASLRRSAADLPGAVLTPLIDEEARARVASAVERALREGKALLAPTAAGPHNPAPSPVLVEIPPSRAATAATAQEEIFGPVLALIPFSREDEALQIANDTRYALTAGVYSRSPATVARAINLLDAGNVYVNRPTTGARVGAEPFGGHKLSGTGPKAGSAEYLWAFLTSGRGFRPGEAGSSGTDAAGIATEPYSAPPAERAAAVRHALHLLRGPWRARWSAEQTGLEPEVAAAAPLVVVDGLLAQLGDVSRPEPTVRLRGQQTFVLWDRPRGCGVVAVDSGAATEALLALMAGPLLAGNAVTLLPDHRHATIAGLLVRALHAGGVPEASLTLAQPDADVHLAAARPAITFAAVDMSVGRARTIYQALAGASASPRSPYLKALITLADGPAPNQPGFLRRFVLPKTVAVRTLHLGAELDLPVALGE